MAIVIRWDKDAITFNVLVGSHINPKYFRWSVIALKASIMNENKEKKILCSKEINIENLW